MLCTAFDEARLSSQRSQILGSCGLTPCRNRKGKSGRRGQERGAELVPNLFSCFSSLFWNDAAGGSVDVVGGCRSLNQRQRQDTKNGPCITGPTSTLSHISMTAARAVPVTCLSAPKLPFGNSREHHELHHPWWSPSLGIHTSVVVHLHHDNKRVLQPPPWLPKSSPAWSRPPQAALCPSAR